MSRKASTQPPQVAMMVTKARIFPGGTGSITVLTPSGISSGRGGRGFWRGSPGGPGSMDMYPGTSWLRSWARAPGRGFGHGAALHDVRSRLFPALDHHPPEGP